MKSNQMKLINIAAACIGALTVIACLTWAHPCTKMATTMMGKQMPMMCHYSARCAIFLGIVLVVIALEAIIRKQRVAFAYIAIGVLLILLPISGVGCGVCMAKGMACHMTALWLRIFGAASCITGVLGLMQKTDKSL